MKGFSLIETIIGVALLLIAFLGIFGSYQLGLKVIGQSKARIIAIALANQKIELVRNLPYDDIGTVGGIPPGAIPETETIVRNNITYTVKTTAIYVDDSFDGLAPGDALPNDYKRAKVKVSWGGLFGGNVALITDIAPKGLETSVGGGNLLILVFDASGLAVPQADIRIVNSSATPPIDVNYLTNNEGKYLVAGAPASVSSYKITASKSGYSADRTYGTEEVANPEKPHATVIEGRLTQISFSADRVSGFSVDAFSQFGLESFSDSFANQSKISEGSNIVVLDGKSTLATTTEGYFPSGYVVSTPIEPVNLKNWDKFSWNDSEPPNTEIKYQIFYAIGTDWYLIPNGDLPGNFSGFGTSPVDISFLATTTYPKLKLKGIFSTNDANSTSELYDWQASWRTTNPAPIGNIQFHLQGSKIIGTDINDLPVYKYSQDHTANSSGHIDITNMEWDAYDFTVDRVLTGLNLVDINPSPQPINLSPNSNQAVKLYLSAENSLLAKVKDIETNEPIFSAVARLYNTGLGYDTTQYTDQKGETVFIPLQAGSYNYEVQVGGYQNSSGNVSVSGDSSKIIYLTPGQI